MRISDLIAISYFGLIKMLGLDYSYTYIYICTLHIFIILKLLLFKVEPNPIDQ